MKLRKTSKSVAEISTASMPDIVFLLLFFFMVSATIKREDNQLDVSVPQAHAVTQVNKKFLVKELHIGYPTDLNQGSTPKILNGKQILQLSNISQWIQEQRSTLDEVYHDQMIIMLKADKNVDMGIIGDIQTELRKNNARKVMFRTLDEI
ncbi:ExbD/TolR family protein [Reichenbachiella versicolor]|uniref:ExbD/TolR family protein n=1 Tax=Reichenbachiella versicolor TaxID=1821036 RepID=UPI000D6EAA8F|nr:biopolymer transporter ExbD [Reichenbachiella versicolor]